MSRGGAGSRRKGSVGERELVKILDGARIRGRTLTARRVPLSGAMSSTGFGGDILLGEAVSYDEAEQCYVIDHRIQEERLEVKRRAQGFKKIDEWLEDAFAVVYRRDRGDWIITMRLDDLIEPKE